MKKICILMATYNGEKYIRCQLDSILNQNCQDQLRILIRDDGSTDGTLKILEEYSRINNEIRYYNDGNLGVCRSFFDLMEHVDDIYDYFAFADQDDYWLEDKIKIAISKLELVENNYINTPCLYASNVDVTDENLKHINFSMKKNNSYVSFGNAVIENICIGCTCVMNKQLFNIIKENIPNNIYMHDAWFYLVASYFGKVYYDKDSYIFYRQHKNNVIGNPRTYIGLMCRRIKNFNKNKGIYRDQLGEFKRIYKLEGKNKKIVECLLDSPHNVRSRLYIILSSEIFRQNKLDTIMLKMLFLFGF